MECNQLIRLIKEWYVHVKNETMAPARMMQFVDKHVSECETCRQDINIQQEVEKIRTHVVPESKIPKAIRIKPDSEAASIIAVNSHQEKELGNDDTDVDDDDTDDDDVDDDDTDVDVVDDDDVDDDDVDDDDVDVDDTDVDDVDDDDVDAEEEKGDSDDELDDELDDQLMDPDSSAD